MIEALDFLRQMDFLGVFTRLTLAMVLGGLVGFDRERMMRPKGLAGFRTYMLVCTAAALTMIISQYEYTMISTAWSDSARAIGVKVDVSRLGAQVINGIGFLGAGTIVTSRQRVKGLTTAAGLWASAVIGLAVGAGFFEGAIITTIMVEIILALFIKLERFLVRRTAAVRVFMEYNRNEALDEVVFFCHSDGRATITNLEINRPKEPKNVAIAMFTVRLSRDIKPQELIHAILAIDGVILAELV